MLIDLEKTIDTLRPGNTARVELTSILAEDVLIVPLVAVRETDDGESYVTLANGQRQVVELGLTTPTHAEVVKGLSEGQRVELVNSADVIFEEFNQTTNNTEDAVETVEPTQP